MGKSKEWILKFFQSDECINVFAENNIKTVILFGSIVTDNFEDYSDVDIAILSENISIDNILKLEGYLEKIFEREIDIIDLISENTHTSIKVNIFDNGNIVYNNDNFNIYNRLYTETENKYKENETFRYFRERDVIWDEQAKTI